MKQLVTMLVGFVCLATQAQSLSCIRPNLARSFNWYQESEDRYRMAVGSVSNLQSPGKYIPGQMRAIRADFTGRLFGLSGLGPVTTTRIILTSTCIASWCGNFPKPNVNSVVFLKSRKTGPVLEIPPCPGGYFPNPSHQTIELLQACLRYGKCTEKQIRTLDYQ